MQGRPLTADAEGNLQYNFIQIEKTYKLMDPLVPLIPAQFHILPITN